MGQQHSKGELLYSKALNGNVEAVKALCRKGASLEWVDSEGKTPLIVACTSSDLFIVAKTLVEHGANVNAYSQGCQGGTPLHHAAGSSLHLTVKLLLSHGANPLVRNDDCQTPLDVARLRGSIDVVRAIENHICFFSGWLREFYGPGFVEALTPQLLSRKIWVVIIPSTPHDPTKPLKLELVIYPTLLDLRPRTVICLWNADIEKPKFHQTDPTLLIFDKSTKTRYRFASSDDDKQQLQWLYDACKGGCLVESQIPVLHDPPTSTSVGAAWPVEVPRSRARAINPATDGRSLLLLSNHQDSDANGCNGNNKDELSCNGWGLCGGLTIQELGSREWRDEYNGWGSFDGPTPQQVSSRGWSDGLVQEEYNGWGVPESTPTRNQNRPMQSQNNANGLGSTVDGSSHSGRGSSFGPAPLEANTSERMDEPAQEQYNVRIVPGLSSYPTQHTEAPGWVPPVVPSNSEIPALVSSSPSAPPILDEPLNEGTNPSIVSIPADLSVVSTDCRVSQKSGEDESCSSLCVICMGASVEGACIPCGHMACCMTCLNEIKSRGGDCPLCRAKIDQVVRIYAV